MKFARLGSKLKILLSEGNWTMLIFQLIMIIKLVS